MVTQKQLVRIAHAAETSPSKLEKPQWPSRMPEQLALLRSLVHSLAGQFTTKAVAKEFRGAKRKEVETALESLEALGLVVSVGESDSRMWSALRPLPPPSRLARQGL
jgi:hypothetical protein